MSYCYPSEKEFVSLTGAGDVIPVYREVLADTLTPIAALKALGNRENTFLLESVEGGERWGRYSFIGYNPHLLVKIRGEEALLVENGAEQKRIAQNPIDFLEELFRSFNPVDVKGLPRYFGGLTGYLGYDLVRFIEDLPLIAHDDLGFHDAVLMAPRTVLVFDNLKNSLMVVENVYLSKDEDPGDAYFRATKRVENTLKTLREGPRSGSSGAGANFELNPQGNVDRETFEEMVQKAKDYVIAGDAIQVVLSQRFSQHEIPDTLDIYRALRVINPSPYMFYLNFGDEVLAGSSPEVLVRLEGDTVTLRPIAGTRPRGKTKTEDLDLEKDLLADPKERAEHVMLVDLGRNDVGRVAEAGTVDVTEFMVIEHYSHVMHIVSNVEGKLKEGHNMFDVLRASFPAGTVSGAPKVRAMEIIEELEPVRRGPYAGAVGYFGFSGNMDLCITIRTIVFKGSTAHFQVGAGIVADSDPAREYQETIDKAMAMTEALKIAGRGLPDL